MNCKCKATYFDTMGHDHQAEIERCPLHLAAPEMLAALKQFVVDFERLIEMNGYKESEGDLWAGPCFGRTGDEARAAIAKAEGKE